MLRNNGEINNLWRSVNNIYDWSKPFIRIVFIPQNIVNFSFMCLKKYDLLNNSVTMPGQLMTILKFKDGKVKIK